MKWTKGLKTAVGFSAVCLYTVFAAGRGGVTSLASPPIASRPPIYKDNHENAIGFVRVTVLDGKPGAHVWQIVGDTYTAYDSLYSPELRKRVGSQAKGTTIGQQSNPSAVIPAVGTRNPDERELKDFEDYCAAHGLRFVLLPAS